MKILTLFGTRPEIIRLSLIIPMLEKHCDHVMVHTGQNYDDNMNGIFLRELGYGHIHYGLGSAGTAPQQMATIFTGLEHVINTEKPDRLFVLGDTNSSMGAIVAKRMGIPVYHMEAGNRCHDPKSPEEINRKIIDHCADIHLCYTEHSRRNLMAEGIPAQHIYVVGNPMSEILVHHFGGMAGGEGTIIANKAGLSLDDEDNIVCTFHRQENVDDGFRLRSILCGLGMVQQNFNAKILIYAHPRTRNMIKNHNLTLGHNLILHEPIGFLSFLCAEKYADLIITDSGTVQEEAAIIGTPCVTIRDTTERPETVESGANMVVGVDPQDILRAAKVMRDRVSIPAPPYDYSCPSVAQAVAQILLS